MKRLVVIGSGPAGISAALYAKRGGAAVTVISKGIAASSLYRAEKIENYYGLADAVSGKELLARGIAGAKNIGVEFITAEVLAIDFSADFKSFTVATTAGNVAASAIVIAAGATRNKLLVPQTESFVGRGVSYCATCDAFFYRGKSVGVVGAGSYAEHELRALLPLTKEVTLFTNGENIAFTPIENVRVVTEKISGLKGGEKLTGAELNSGEIVAVDGLFIALGTAGSTELARKLGIMLDKNNIKTDSDMRTNVAGIFAAGDCTGGLLQVVKAAHEGAVAGMAAVKFLRG